MTATLPSLDGVTLQNKPNYDYYNDLFILEMKSNQIDDLESLENELL